MLLSMIQAANVLSQFGVCLFEFAYNVFAMQTLLVLR